MEAVRLRLLAWRRRRWRGLTLVVLLAGIAAGAVLALAAGARRTASGADRYTHHLGGDPDLILRQPFGSPVTDAIAQIPEVREARSMTFVSAFPVGADGPVLDPNPWAGDERALGSRPAEGRFTDAGAADEMTVNKPAADLPVILDGRAPSAPNEIALGRILARDLDRSIDDTVTAIAADGSQHELRIVGYTVSPTDGGRGASMTFDALHSLVPDATRNLLLVDYRVGASRNEVQARLETVTYTPPDTDTVPPSVRAFELVIPAAFALTIILALMVTAALTYHLASSVHRRTRDLAILRALGADRRQLRATVHWQACFVAAAGLVIGVPLGIAVGTRIHKSIANRLGVVPTVATPNLIALAMIAGILFVANVSAIVPARRATRAPAATILRETVTAET